MKQILLINSPLKKGGKWLSPANAGKMQEKNYLSDIVSAGVG